MANHVFKLMETPSRSAEDNLLRGTINLSIRDLARFAPHYSGHTQIFVMKQPAFMADYRIEDTINGIKGSPIISDADKRRLKTEANKHAATLKNLIEFGSLSYSGTPDLSVNTQAVETGYAGVNIQVPTSTAFDGDTFTIKIFESRGEPLRKAIEFYLTGLFDPYGQAGHLHGSAHHYSAESFAMEIAVVQFDPTMKEVQDVSYWQNVMIKQSVDRDNLNWNQGTIDIVQPKDVQFSGRYVANANHLLSNSSFNEAMNRRLALIKTIGDFNLSI